MSLSILFLLFILPVALCLNHLLIGAFNIKTFGSSKAENDDVMDDIQEIVLQYDVMLIQEIRDKSQGVFEVLHKRLNSVGGVEFSYIKSDRLGRSSYKEQYAFFYRKDKLDVIGTLQYNDTNDYFEREPFSIVLRVPLQNDIDVMFLALVGVHIKPKKHLTLAEIDKLDEVKNDVEEKLFTENAFIMGDFNADCSYISEDELATTEVFNSSAYLSLINSTTDTTTTTTDCAYDRIIASGTELMSKTLDAGVYRFDQALNLTTSETQAVSDHYPVRVNITL